MQHNIFQRVLPYKYKKKSLMNEKGQLNLFESTFITKNALSLYFDYKSIKKFCFLCLFSQEIDPNYLINYLVYFWNRE